MRKWGIIFIFLYTIVFYFSIFIFKDHHFFRQLLSICIFPVIGIGVSLYWTFQSNKGLNGKPRKMLIWLSLGNISFIVAQMVWFYQMDFLNDNSSPSLADLFWISQYVFYIVAISYSVIGVRYISLVKFIFNIAIYMTTAISLSGYFLIKPILETSSDSIWTMIISLTYPIIDLVLFFATLGLYSQSKYDKNKKILSIIALGLFLQISTDTVHTYLLSKGLYEPGGYLDPLWVVAILVMGMASTYAPSFVEQSKLTDKISIESNRYRDLFPYLSAFILLLFTVTHHKKILHIDSLDLGFILVSILIMISQILTMFENQKLVEELKFTNEELATSEDRYRRLLEISPSAIFVDVNSALIFVNKAGLELVGASASEQLIGKSVFEFHKNYNHVIHTRHKGIDLRKNTMNYYEYPVKRMDGKVIYVESRVAEVNFKGERAWITVSQDITYRKESEAKIKYMAYFDELTGLPNRSMFNEHLKGKINKAKAEKGQFAVMFIDLDRFKIINDTMGHTFGNAFLKEVSQRMAVFLDSQSKLYRFGGDEFCILLDEAEFKKAITLAQKMINGFTNVFMIENHEFYTTPSIGISIYPNDGVDEDTLIKCADMAMYKAKNSGGNNFQLYTKELDEENFYKMEMEKSLRKAIGKQEFFIYYQPKVNLESGLIIGVEALIRWEHPLWGPVSPLQFIPTAEETGMIIPIGIWILNEACIQLKKWHDAGFSKLQMAVNISPRQLQDKDLLNDIKKVLKEANLLPEFLYLEITENIMENFQESMAVLFELKKIGVKISIDDFGTGYSSLSYLKNMPIDEIKIDKSFVDDIPANEKDIAIINTIIDMGHHLQVKVTAEGIESQQQYSMLRKHRCHVGQGYYFSKPLPADEVELLFNKTFLTS